MKTRNRKAIKAEARLVYRKAKQVSSVTYNLFTIAKKMDSEPPVAGISAPVEVRESVRSELIRQFPTMESLFGSMDFCECDHCRSVLSPAAYLVDLLQFVDAEPGVWGNFLAQWKATHANQDYPHKDKNGNPKKPYAVLEERRPDLAHIALTCENTHTALPYIDLVNEVLEYYVANGKLEEKAAHDTGEATTAELLAEPQNVIRGAYDKLREAHYPLALPFDLWIETVRQFCNYFETPLTQVLEVFRPNDDLFAPAQPFDRSAIFMESLGLSSAELALFTDADPLANDKWHELYGFPTARPAILNPTNAVNATLSIANADAGKLREGMACTYFDASANALSAESKTVSAIGASDSGGAGLTLITFEGVWAARPDAGDLLVCDAPATLKSAKTLARRLGVTYKEIAQIVQTGFVNPKLAKLGVLYKLGASIRDARFYLDHKGLLPQDPTTLSTEDQKRLLEVKAFSQELGKLAVTFNVTVAQLEAELQAIPFDGVLVLADPDAGCDFDLTTLRYANGGPADAIAFLRINLFVRLWRRLGWSIEETDRVLQAFVPRDAPFVTAHLSKQPLKTALIYLAHLKALDEKLRVGKQSRLKLIALWSDIATTGRKPLYAQLFLTPSVLKSDPVFDHPLGQYLSAAGVKVKAHALALQGALGLTADEIGRILVDAGMSFDAADLSLPNVSLLYRYGLLAKALKLSVRELIALKQFSGLDPFTQLHPGPLADTPAGVVPAKKAIELDYPFSQTLRFVEVAEAVKDSGLKIEDLEYLLRHRFDATAKYRPDPDGALALLKTLAEGVRAIRAEHAVPNDPGAMSDEALKQKLGLALPPDVVERFLAMMNGTAEFTATKAGVAPADQLKQAGFIDEPAIGEIRYNAARQEQKLTFRGVLFDAEKTPLKARLPKPAPLAAHVASPVLNELLDSVQQQARAFFEKQLQKQAPNVQPASGFLDAADFGLLFDRNLVLAAGETEQDRIRNRRVKLANAFLPFLQALLIRQFIVQTMTAHTDADPVLVESLLADERLLAGPRPLLETFSAVGERGVSADFFDSFDGSGVRQPTGPSVVAADTSLKARRDKDGNLLNPAGSARFEGYLQVPTPGAYRFFAVLDKQNAEAELRFLDFPQPVVFTGKAAQDKDELGNGVKEFLELKPGIPYRFSLDLKKLNGGEARLLVQGETLPKDSVSQLTLYPLAAIQGAQRAVLLLTKALQLVQGLGLTEREIRYLLTHAAAFDGLSLSPLPTRSSDDTLAGAKALFGQFLRLAAYARLKRDLAGGTDDLIGIFEANETTDADKLDKKVYPLVAKLTRRDEATVKATAELLAAAPVFESEKPIRGLWEALQVVERFGVPVASLTEWNRIVSAAATPEQRFKIARDLKEAIKARFEPEAWQRVAQPIFDKLRQRQRDALVAHVMHQHGFASMEQLYEYFLIDPGMEPVVQTSRIRLAIGSLQLFVQRCLLNMELQVHPSVINSKQWEWMKRYRVWEANRKIFLFPENWLEPEFRDDKTHLFAELEGALLQGDVSSDLAEDAFLNYLKKLDELARLEIAAMHLEDNADPARRSLHVIGRTYSQPHKYFYRRYVHQTWTAWEPVSTEIQGDHLAPVIWRNRLYLFWVTFMDKAAETPPTGTAATTRLSDLTLSGAMSGMRAMATTKLIEVQLHWSEYVQGEWSTAVAGSYSPVTRLIATWLGDFPELHKVSLGFDGRGAIIHVSKEYDEQGEERGVFVHLTGEINKLYYLAGRNSAPFSHPFLAAEPAPAMPYSYGLTLATQYMGAGKLTVEMKRTITTESGKPPVVSVQTPPILQQVSTYTLLPCDNNLTALGISEEAYGDAANPAAIQAAIESGLPEIASLMKPLFYQDELHTLFVEPSVTERTIEKWEEWVTRTPQAEPAGRTPHEWREIVVIPEIPRKEPIPPLGPKFGLDIDRASRINPLPDRDWLVNEGTGLLFEGELIGPAGRAGTAVLPSTKVAVSIAEAGSAVNIHAGSGLPEGSRVVLTDATTLEQTGLMQAAGGLNVIGSGGLSSGQLENFKVLNRSGFAAGNAGGGLIGR